MKTGSKKQLTICIFLILLNLIFIWGNSMLPRNQSSEISTGIESMLAEFLKHSVPGGDKPIRKLAHFSEFACLGILLTWLSGLLRQQHFHKFTLPLLLGTLAALLDETIQALNPGRGPSVIDVWIDVSGCTAGILILLLGQHLWRKQKSNGGNES